MHNRKLAQMIRRLLSSKIFYKEHKQLVTRTCLLKSTRKIDKLREETSITILHVQMTNRAGVEIKEMVAIDPIFDMLISSMYKDNRLKEGRKQW